MIDGQKELKGIIEQIDYFTSKESDKKYSKIKAIVHIAQIDQLIEYGLITFDEGENVIQRIKKIASLTDDEVDEAHLYI